MRAPDAPSGCDSAIAPPETLVRSRSSPSSFSTAQYCEPKASFTSTRSIWSSSIPAFSERRARGRHRPDPHVLRLHAREPPGDQPADRRTPLRSAHAREAITTAAAPSPMPEALPAVTVPPSLK
jgi:hypothetical protein